jgi:hypothetical protein
MFTINLNQDMWESPGREVRMDWSQRSIIGALGGAAAILSKYIAQDHAFISQWSNIGDPRYSDILLGYAILTPILIFLGAVIAGCSDETNKLKLLALAVSAPALVTTWAGGATPREQRPAPPPTPGPAGWELRFSPVGTAFAADGSIHLAQGSIQRGVEAFFGAGKGEQRYWVIAGSFRDRAEAEDLARRINQQRPAMNAFVGKRAPNNEFYPVIVGNYVPLANATRLRDEISQVLGGEQAYLSAFPDRRP